MSSEVPPGAPPPGGKNPRRLARHFRWQALFQQARDPVFVLDRRRRLLFVNRAWEELTGIKAADAAEIVARRPDPASPDDPPDRVLGHALTPPPEVLQGAAARARRLLPGPRWWEVEFLPVALGGELGGHLIVGRIRVLPAEAQAIPVALPEKLVNLRQRAVRRLNLDDWQSALPSVRRLVAQARLAAQVAVPVLLLGEAGTGKQTLARLIHQLGPHRERPFAVLDCARLPPAAVAGVLWGERGAAPAGAPGAVYLREPGALPRDLQQRLCERLARAEGPRFFAGCRAAPAEEVQAGRLLEELACALGALVLEVPPLRQRQADLPALVERLLARANAAQETQCRGLAPAAWEVVRAHAWPGNFQELYAALSGACGRAAGERITVADLPAEVRLAVQMASGDARPAGRPLGLDRLLEQAERRLIELALKRARGKKNLAAQLLGIPVPRLFRRLKALGLMEGEAGESGEGGEEVTLEVEEEEPPQGE